MSWTVEAKRRAAIYAPTSGGLLRDDTQVIERPGWYQLITPSAPGSMLNEVILSEIVPQDVDRVIDEVIAQYAAIDHPVKWCVGPWTKPEGFGERLARRGFASWDVRGMVAETTRALPCPDDVVVDEVGANELDRFVDANVRGWAIPLDQVAAERALYARALATSPLRVHCFVARADDAIAGTAALILGDDHAYLIGTQVFPAFRGRGAYRALVGARLAFLARRDVAIAVTQAREATSAPILEHLGFETVFRSRCYRLEPGTA